MEDGSRILMDRRVYRIDDTACSEGFSRRMKDLAAEARHLFSEKGSAFRAEAHLERPALDGRARWKTTFVFIVTTKSGRSAEERYENRKEAEVYLEKMVRTLRKKK